MHLHDILYGDKQVELMYIVYTYVIHKRPFTLSLISARLMTMTEKFLLSIRLQSRPIGDRNFPVTVMSRTLKKSQCKRTYRIIVTLIQFFMKIVFTISTIQQILGE